jgi:hypothetical protein
VIDANIGKPTLSSSIPCLLPRESEKKEKEKYLKNKNKNKNKNNKKNKNRNPISVVVTCRPHTNTTVSI